MAKQAADANLKGMGGDESSMDLGGIADALQKARAGGSSTEQSQGEEKGAGPGPGLESGPSPLEKITGAFTPRKIRRLIALPGEIAFVRTGIEELRLRPEEIDLMADDVTDLLNAFVKINPLWLAAISLTVNGSAITMDKISIYKKHMAKRKADAEAGK